MTLKKWLIFMVTVTLASAAFAFPAPPDDTDPLTQAMEQYDTQMEELNKLFDQQILPEVKAILSIEKEKQNAGASQLTPAQQKEETNHVNKINTAVGNVVEKATQKLSESECDQLMKQYGTWLLQQMFLTQQIDATTYDQSLSELNTQTFTKKDYREQLTSSLLGSAFLHFIEEKTLSEQEIETVIPLFFPQEEQEDEE